ncbi:unnamed protein product [Parnassius mnemosyne]|uniref:RecA family profile 1 domain-containing protein n=1 Tax=Parnassius mnemosyne TaxID=213953 RepID=A0AAV1KPM2_9NEOP
MNLNVLKSLLPPNIFEKIDKAGIATPRQLLVLSVWDIKKVTNIATEDILFLKNVVSNSLNPSSFTCDELLKTQKVRKIATRCINIDNLLHGGFRTGTITEVYGESGSGKTQLGIIAAINSWPNKSVYICTEDLFPVKRLNQIIDSSRDKFDSRCAKHIFVEHLTESHELLSCVRVRLPKLLEANEVSVIIIDSIAAPFRCESTNYVKRAEDLREVAIMLLSLAQKYNLAIICINQVTASFGGSLNVLPSLGLAWSNMVTYRLCLKKIAKDVNLNNKECLQKNSENLHCNTYIRELSIVYAPDLPNSSTKFIITSDGVQSI